jgi:transposase-like protein
MEVTTNYAENNQPAGPLIFVPADVVKAFGADYLDETACRSWILKAIHGTGEAHCPECQVTLSGIASQRFWEGRRICCRSCGKYFTAMTGTFLGGCHLSFQEIILFAVFLYFKIPAAAIAKILKISNETVRLWEIKFQSLERMNSTE